MAQGAYENPQLTAVDYSVVDRNIAQGVQALSQSMVSIAQQRKEAYQRVQEEFAKFKDLSYIQQAKGLDAQTMDAIRQSTNNVTSLADFSNRTEYEKSQILNSVKDTKAAMASVEEMIKLKNSGAVLDKRANKEYYDLLANLSSMRGVRVKPAEDRVGFTLISDTFDKDGNKVGEEEFTESDLIAMPSMFQDVSPVLEGVDAQIKEMAASSQKGWENAVANGQDFTRENIRDKISSYVDEMEEEEKSVYFSQRIFEFGEFAPPMDGSISKEERERIKSLNNETIKEYITDRVWERLNKPVDPEIEMQRRARYSRSDSGSGDEINPEDLNEARRFREAYYRFIGEGDKSYISEYLTSLQLTLNENEDGTFDVIKERDLSQIQDLEQLAQLDEESGRTLKFEKIGTIDPENPMEFFRTYKYIVTDKTKGNVLKINPWVKYITDKDTEPSEDFKTSMFNLRNSRLNKSKESREAADKEAKRQTQESLNRITQGLKSTKENSPIEGYSLEEVEEASKASGMSVDEYVEWYNSQIK